jgi:hypothetical protein
MPEHRALAEPVEFHEFGTDILTSEHLSDLAYRAFLTLMAKQYMSGQAGCLEPLDRDLAYLLIEGVYAPCVRRITYTRHVDQHVDGLPDHAAVFNISDCDKNDCTIEQVRRVDRFPPKVAAVVPGIKYKHVCWHRDLTACRRERRYNTNCNDVLSGYDGYCTVAANDRVHHAVIHRPYGAHSVRANALHTVWPVLVLNAWADRRYLWQVRTSDHVMKFTATPLTLGVGEEHVKSLFYARTLPVTETGRKRPILHWVQAHARRLREGIEVDVRKHLRGITEFEMDGLKFEIISPDKGAERAEAMP